MNSQTGNFVERMGVALESDGLPRIAGRIFGLLLVSEDARSLTIWPPSSESARAA